MVIRYSSTNKKVRRKIKQNINEYDYSNVAISLIITKLLSFIFAFYSIINLFIPWLLLSLIFSVIGYKKYKSGNLLKLIIINILLIIIEIMIIFIVYKKIFG
jgi:hypothetical protein